MRWWLVVLLLPLAGCAQGEDADPRSGDCNFVESGDGSEAVYDHCSGDWDAGDLAGVVVDQGIVPVVGATVAIDAMGVQATTNEEGFFVLRALGSGSYFLNVTHPLYLPAQVLGVAGDGDGELVKVQLVRRFSEDPYLEGVQMKGYMNCGYSAGLSSPCILDYTQLLPICPGGCLEELYGVSGDIRRFVVPIDAGWQSRINEMSWTPSTGTSESMGMTISFYNRTSSHSYTSAAGPSPLRHQMDVDPERSHPEWVPQEGKEDYLVFVNPAAEGSDLPVAAMVEQHFELFVHTFYYGPAPDGWSFVDGDSSPFWGR